MDEKEIVEAIKNIKKAMETGKKEDIDKVRKSDTLKFFLAVLENLKEEKWKGIEEVKSWINEYIEGKKTRITQRKHPEKKISITYNDKFEFEKITLPSTEKGTYKREVVDYLAFKFKEYENLWFSVCIPMKEEKIIEEKIIIGIYVPYGKSDESIGKKFNEEAKKLEVWEEMDVEISGEFPKNVAEKMEDLLDRLSSKKDELIKLVNKWFQQKKSVNKHTSPKETENSKSPLSSILNALQTKPFLILAGISGTGKTQIARLIANLISKSTT